jgi:hypothetical protein
MMEIAQTIARNIMERFLERHQGRILGVLSGFDRMLFRGTLRSICHLTGMDMFLSSQRVLYKDFGAYVNKLSEQLKAHAEALARSAGRPLRYVASAEESKEEIARKILDENPIREGLVCVLTCVEPCQTFSIRKDRDNKLLRLVAQPRKCLHIYFYYLDRDFGLMHIRLQSWLPFPIQVCLNGREYLARQLSKTGIGYEQRDNCFVRIDDLRRAQALLDRLVKRKWPHWLRVLGRRHNPLVNAATGLRLHDYYWTLRQGEWASDIMFKDAAALAEIYPTLVRHAILQFGSQQVLRFLGRRTNARFNGEVRSELKHRPEGICVKHWVEENSIKMYDKHGSILRIETTINNPRRFQVRRGVTRKGQRCMAWVPMRKSVADIPRLTQVSQAANQRYLQALALIDLPQPVHRVLDPVSHRVVKDGRPYRALRPITAEETAWFRILLNGAFRIQGFRNPEVRRMLFPQAERNSLTRRQAAARVTRLFRLLRAHGLIRKAPGRRYYRVTDKGTQVMTTAVQMREANTAACAA